jgi:hypothetical protein
MPVCQGCGEANPARARFCLACGAALAAAAPRGDERKVVSVLFCDLVGFTSRAEQLDVEDVRGVLRPYYARLPRELERFGGTVEKFIGDAVMALFGASVAREDDPERAVRAALATGRRSPSSTRPTRRPAMPRRPGRTPAAWSNRPVRRCGTPATGPWSSTQAGEEQLAEARDRARARLLPPGRRQRLPARGRGAAGDSGGRSGIP